MNAQTQNATILDAALEYAALGWHVFPVPPGSKRSHKAAQHSDGRKWGSTNDAAEIRRDWSRWPDANIGIACGPKSGMFAVDADSPEGHGKDGLGALDAWLAEHGPLPHTLEAATPSNGRHVLFRYPSGQEVRNSESKLAQGVDVRGDGGILIAAPSIKPGVDAAYRWINPPGLFKLGDCPQWLLAKIATASAKPETKARSGAHSWRAFTAEEAEVFDLLSYISPDAGGYGEWLNVLMALHDWGGGGRRALDMADAWSASGPSHRPGEVAEKWRSFKVGGGVGLGTIAKIARENGADLSEIARRHKAKSRSAGDGDSAEDQGEKRSDEGGNQDQDKARSFEELMAAAKALGPDDIGQVEAICAEASLLPPLRLDQVLRAISGATGMTLTSLREQAKGGRESDEPDHLDLARLTLEGIGRDDILCADQFVWRWSGTGVWKQHDDRAIKQDVQKALDEAKVEVTAARVNGVADVLKTAIYRREHQFNLGAPETVNCLNGEVELEEKGWTLKPHRREHYRTTQIPVEYDQNAEAPMFRKFLSQIFRDDPDHDQKMQAVLELIGYSLMSHANHEKFVMLIGPGANGKSVLLMVLEALLGCENVAGVQPANFDRSFQRAHLHQKLANIVTELKQGEVIADAELKGITSGEPSTVEHKFKDPFVMRPFATCWFGTNHMPHTRDFSEALFRRATILTFNRTFELHEQDTKLKDKRHWAPELPGILNMALTAYGRAIVNGFTYPPSSETAKREWRLEADQAAQFVEDACVAEAWSSEKTRDVFLAYQSWAAANGIGRTLTDKGLRDRLTRLGFGSHRDMRGRYVTGIRLIDRWGYDAS